MKILILASLLTTPCFADRPAPKAEILPAAAPTPQLPQVEIYSMRGCIGCSLAKGFFESRNIPFIEHDVQETPAKYQELKQKGLRTVPQIFIKGKHVGTYRDLDDNMLKEINVETKNPEPHKEINVDSEHPETESLPPNKQDN